MIVEKLIKQLQLIEDKSLDVRIEIQTYTDEDTNYWLSNIEVSNTGSSGYEVAGEVTLIGTEWKGFKSLPILKMILMEFNMSLNENQDSEKYKVRSNAEKLNLIAKFICYVHRNDEDITADDVCHIIKDITLDEMDSGLEDLLDVWIASEDMQKILAEEDEVRH